MSEQRTNRPQPEKVRRRRIFYIILIILLLGINGFLFYNNMNTNKQRKTLVLERNELLEQRVIFEQKIDSLKGILEAARGLNVELDSIINTKIAELDALKISFNRKLANKDLEINDLKKELDKNLEAVARLKEEYTADVEEWKQQYESAINENRQLSSKIQKKEQEIQQLEQKVDRGTVLTAVNLLPKGIQYRNNNREKETDRAKRTDKLQVCFSLAENRIAEPGIKEIYLRILSPEGSTMAIQSQGSGTFELAESGESSLFTKKITLDYDPAEPDKQYCTDWRQDNEFVPGNYVFELYQNGFLIGTTTLELEQGGLF